MIEDNSACTATRPFYPDMALYHLEGISTTMDEISAIASAAMDSVKARDGDADLGVIALFRVIEGLAEDAANYYALRDILEGLKQN